MCPTVWRQPKERESVNSERSEERRVGSGNRGGKGRGDCGRRTAQTALGVAGLGAATQRGSGESADSDAVATREHHDVEMDSASAAHGKLDACVQLSGGSQKNVKVSIVRDRKSVV